MNELKPNDLFVVESSDGAKECKLITSMYSEERKKYYVIYAPVDNDEEIYVSSFLPNDDKGNLEAVEDEKELAEIAQFLEEYGSEI